MKRNIIRTIAIVLILSTVPNTFAADYYNQFKKELCNRVANTVDSFNQMREKLLHHIDNSIICRLIAGGVYGGVIGGYCSVFFTSDGIHGPKGQGCDECRIINGWCSKKSKNMKNSGLFAACGFVAGVIMVAYHEWVMKHEKLQNVENNVVRK